MLGSIGTPGFSFGKGGLETCDVINHDDLRTWSLV
jgi:hypothetical protein